MIVFLAVASVGAGAILFMLVFIFALAQESRLRHSRVSDPRRRSLTLVMLERYRKDRAA
jgi:hypothetical protein